MQLDSLYGACSSMSIVQTEAAFEIVADLPGVAKSDVQLDVEKDTLTIGVKPAAKPDAKAKPADDKAEKEDKAEAPATEKQDAQPAEAQKTPEASAKPEEKPQPKMHRKERSQHFAKRALQLPETADLSSVDASLTDGVLKIVIAKKELPTPKRIRIA